MQIQLLNERKSIRLSNYDYSQNGLYYLTICTKNRECIFGEIKNSKIILSKFGKIADNCWSEIPQHFSQVSLHEYVIMPNHIHGIIEINVVGAKHLSPSNCLEKTNQKCGTSQTIGSIVRGLKKRNYYEHIINSEIDYLKTVNYIIENPLKWNNDINKCNTNA